MYERAVGAGTVRTMAYAGRRETVQFLAIPVATQRNPLSGGGVVDLRGRRQGEQAREDDT